ncbi:serine/threonine-protein kinase [Comamonas sp. JC664]|uniref:serine/threonine-protein kinase n=1 Tax=Comamonas sp. JC664 TaxID=2801917 RepID=UPI0017486E98|nr:serine/threonine-protein kinase [Comamonas sp. JC664]MBL0696381.1 serine/threonine protein kinase [Comamonas sp. JC664]GHG83983.1 hypothetical protein GCM10012319_39030 [Comamonas sp. KCTC 72670]
MAGGSPRNPEVSLYGDALEPGALVGDWVIESRVHAGVTAWLYRASHLATRTPAAVKVVRAEFNHVPGVLRRFKQEADTLQALRHPHIVEVLEYGELRDGRPWLAMAWLAGESVDQWLARKGPFSLAETLTVMEELGAALHFAHERGVLHRDLKAQNVMLLPRAEGFTVKLVDFGIARVDPPEGLTGLTTGGAVLGTPVSMAPEQIRGLDVDPRTDLYAMGVLLYQLLTGVLPFQGTSAVELEEQHLHAPPPRLTGQVHAPPALDGVLQRCLAKSREERWADVPAFLAALRAALTPDEQAHWAAALYVEVRLPEAMDEPADADLDARDAAMDTVLTVLESQGWGLAMESGNAVLAWRPLPSTPGRRELEHTRELADAVLQEAREAAGPAVEVRVYVHAAPSELGADADGQARLVGGELLRVERWAVEGAPGELRASAAFPPR